MKKYGLIGYPLGHSFSKGYFTEKFEREGMADCEYNNYPIDHIERFPEVLEKEPDLKGLNVTIITQIAYQRLKEETGTVKG